MRTLSAAILTSVIMLGALSLPVDPPALAQSHPKAAPPSEQTQEQLELMMEGDKIIGMAVIGSDGQSVGEVKDVVVGTDGQMQSAIIETGGFLGMGGRLIAVPVNRLRIDGGRINADLTREKAADMPEHKDPTGK